MAIVKVWNKNTHPFTTTFKGDKITIPPQGFVEMEYYDAYEFRGQYHPQMLDHDGIPLPSSYKMIQVEDSKSGAPVFETSDTKCMACKFNGTTKFELERHTKEAHSETLLVNEELDKELALKKASEPTKAPNGPIRKEVR